MASFYLLNAVKIGGVQFRPGDKVDDVQLDTSKFAAVGGVLWPATDAIVTTAANIALERRRNGASDLEIGPLMQAASIASVLAASSGGAFSFDSGTNVASITASARTALATPKLQFVTAQVTPVFGQAQSTVGAGSKLTIQPQLGKVAGTDLSGDARVDLGASVANTSAKFGVDVDRGPLVDFSLVAAVATMNFTGAFAEIHAPGLLSIDTNGNASPLNISTYTGNLTLDSYGGSVKITSTGQTKLGYEFTAAGFTGFNGATPVAKPTGVAVTAAGIHAALTSLGLIAP